MDIPRLTNSSDKDIVKRTLYDEVWGIHNHEKDHNPFSLVAPHSGEALYGKNTILERRLRIYHDNYIQKYLGMSFIEFLDLTRPQQEIITRFCSEQRIKDSKRDNAQKDQVINEIKELTGEK